MRLHNLLDYYKVNGRNSEYMKIRHCMIDQVTARLKSGRCLINQVSAWLKSGGCRINQAAVKVKSVGCLIDQAALRLKSGSCLIDQDPNSWEVYPGLEQRAGPGIMSCALVWFNREGHGSGPGSLTHNCFLLYYNAAGYVILFVMNMFIKKKVW